MARVQVVWWRDIPAQVTAGAGRNRARAILPDRFQIAIDAAATRAGVINADDYLAEWREMKTMLVKAITRLPDTERTVITLYYGEELLLKEIGGVLGVTESRVSQLHSRALYRLNQELRSS